MDISRLLPIDEVSALAGIALLCGCYLGAFWVSRIAWALRRPGSGGSGIRGPRVAWVTRVIGSAGVVLACVSPVAAVGAKGGGRSGGTPRQAAPPPWDSSPLTEKTPEARAGARSSDRPWESDRHPRPSTTHGTHRSTKSYESSAPPWSGDGSSPPRPFRRTGAAADVRPDAREEDRGAGPESDHQRTDMDRGATTPEAQGSGGSRTMHEPTRREWTVRRGDTLWDIAGEVLDTSDQARIARYWPAIHRANRETIGPDPSLLFPGQILSLPEEDNAR